MSLERLVKARYSRYRNAAPKGGQSLLRRLGIAPKKEGREPVIGRMGDVEVVLLHYPSFAEARAKWDRRKARIRWDNLLVKYSDQNGFEPEDFETFRALPFANKVFLTVNPEYGSGFTTVIPDRWQAGYAVDDIKSSFRVMHVNDVLNRMIREERK